MLNITEIENALYEWVFNVTNLQVIFANQNAPRPTTPYVLIHIVQSTPLGIEESRETLLIDNSVDIDYSNVEELFISINVYYADAYQTGTKLKDSLGRVTVTDDLFSHGIGYLKTSDVRDMPEVINKQWEERSQFDCFFIVRSLDTENIESIRQIEIKNKLDDSEVIIKHPDI